MRGLVTVIVAAKGSKETIMVTLEPLNTHTSQHVDSKPHVEYNLDYLPFGQK